MFLLFMFTLLEDDVFVDFVFFFHPPRFSVEETSFNV